MQLKKAFQLFLQEIKEHLQRFLRNLEKLASELDEKNVSEASSFGILFPTSTTNIPHTVSKMSELCG